MQSFPQLKYIVDLTNTSRYYDKKVRYTPQFKNDNNIFTCSIDIEFFENISKSIRSDWKSWE